MNLANMWQHPKTTAVGILTALSAVLGALATTGNTQHWIIVGSAVATALLGALARDPMQPTPKN